MNQIVFKMLQGISNVVEQTIAGTGDIDAHLMTLFSIAVSIKAKNIVELGVREDYTTAPLLHAVQMLDGRLYSVDVKNRIWDIPIPQDLQKHWEFHEVDSIEFLSKWDKTKTIDLVLIDDLHTYEHVANELKIIEDLITPKSVILLHDLMYGNWEPKYHSNKALKSGQWAGGGPYRAVNELDKNLWEFSTIPSCNGLTILRKRAVI
jgi:predicted O-methyltransferase YrrM